MNICELIFGSERAFVLFFDRFFFPEDPLSFVAGGGVEVVVDEDPFPPPLDLCFWLVSAMGLQCKLLLLFAEMTPLPEWSRSETGVFRKISKGLLLMSSDFRGGFRCGNGGGMSGLLCWECLFFLLLLLLAVVGGEKAPPPRLVLELLCERFASLSLSFLRVPRLSEDRERGNSERKAGVEWWWAAGGVVVAVAVAVGGDMAFTWDDLVSIGAKCAD